MSLYTWRQGSEADLPPAWRPLDRAVAQWVQVHGGSAQLADVAGWASYADGLGDAALPLLGADAGRHGMTPPTPEQVETLRAQALVGDGSRRTPFVLDADGRFAFWRNHAHESAIALQVAQRRRAAVPVDASALAADLDALFAHDDAAAQRQRDAVAAAVGRRLFVLTGGPGTGKTTTVLRLLLMLQRHAAAAPVIQLAAPTGKAAQRLLQSLRAGKAALRAGAGALPDDWQPLLDRIPEQTALTLHRLLGYEPRRNRFTRGHARPIAADIVVIDEASMLDLAMLRSLLDAVRDDATLILLGDADQLTSVAAGSVLMDLVAALEREQAPELVRLQHSFRAQRELARLNEAVREGDAAAFGAALAAAAPRAVQRPVTDMATLRAFAQDWAAALAALPLRPSLPLRRDDGAGGDDSSGYGNGRGVSGSDDAVAGDSGRRDGAGGSGGSAGNGSGSRGGAGNGRGRKAAAETADVPYQASLFAPAVREPEQMAREALRSLGQRQLLCALREDAFGALALNALIETELRRLWQVEAESPWYPGRAVLITQNDYGQHLFNGDVGLCLADADGRLRVWFEADSGTRAFAPESLPAHEGAFAITVHKSQGSEYAHVAVLLPPDPEHRILSRQLLYTGISRARERLDLCASAEVVAASLARPIRRAGGLAAKLRQSAVA
jgi:ATP-dependent exoDNAse (exonuclease V) alpha subunit